MVMVEQDAARCGDGARTSRFVAAPPPPRFAPVLTTSALLLSSSSSAAARPASGSSARSLPGSGPKDRASAGGGGRGGGTGGGGSEVCFDLQKTVAPDSKNIKQNRVAKEHGLVLPLLIMCTVVLTGKLALTFRSSPR
ncbi:hypothetical protein ACP70R_017218 [Stipagrostis hirtigluma subsp. patula]